MKCLHNFFIYTDRYSRHTEEWGHYPDSESQPRPESAREQSHRAEPQEQQHQHAARTAGILGLVR